MSEIAVAEATETRETPATEAASTEPELNTDLLKELGLDGGTEPEPQSTEPSEPEVEEPDDVALAVEEATKKAREEGETEGQRKAREEQEAADKRAENQRRLEGIQQAYRNRVGKIDATLKAVIRGDIEMTDDLARAFVGEFQAHHAQMETAIVADLWEEFTDRYPKAKLSPEAAQSIIDARKSGKLPNLEAVVDSMLDSVKKDAQKGRFTEAEVAKREAAAVTRLNHKWLTDEKFRERQLSKVNTPESRSASASSTRNPDAVLDDPSASADERARAFERKHGFRLG